MTSKVGIDLLSDSLGPMLGREGIPGIGYIPVSEEFVGHCLLVRNDVMREINPIGAALYNEASATVWDGSASRPRR